MSQVGREGAHRGDRYLRRLEEAREREVTWTEGRPSAPQCGRRRSQALYWFAAPEEALSPPARSRNGRRRNAPAPRAH